MLISLYVRTRNERTNKHVILNIANRVEHSLPTLVNKKLQLIFRFHVVQVRTLLLQKREDVRANHTPLWNGTFRNLVLRVFQTKHINKIQCSHLGGHEFSWSFSDSCQDITTFGISSAIVDVDQHSARRQYIYNVHQIDFRFFISKQREVS